MSLRLSVLVPRDIATELFIPYVQRAEELGFDGVWIVEDCFFRGGFSQAAIALASTNRIHVGVGIIPAAVRNAAMAALEIATLAEFYPGRTTIGIGHGMPGWMRQIGQWPASPLTMLDETITATKRLLGGETLNEEGRYVRLREVSLEAAPLAIPPILAGVRGPKSLALSGRVADGTILAEPTPPSYIRAAIESIGAQRDHHLVGYSVAAISEDRDAAIAAARPALEWVGEPDWAPHIAGLPFASEFYELRASSASRAEFAQALPTEWLADLGVIGTAADGRLALDRMHTAGFTEAVLIPVGPNPLEDLESFTALRG